MKRYFWICLMFMGTLCLQSCEKETMVYEGEPDNKSGIYFLYNTRFTIIGGMNIADYQDSMEFSFANVAADVPEYKLNVPVNILGNLADRDRTFKVKIADGTAIEGEDYEPLKEQYVVPANKEKAYFPLVLRRTDKLKKGKCNLIIELVENENFRLLLSSKLNNDGKTVVNTIRMKVIFSEIYTEPFFYSIFGKNVFGKFTLPKFEFLNTVMGWAPVDWGNGKVTGNIMTYAGRRVQAELQERADNNDPVYDENKVLMQLEAPFTVDYSKYETE